MGLPTLLLPPHIHLTYKKITVAAKFIFKQNFCIEIRAVNFKDTHLIWVGRLRALSSYYSKYLDTSLIFE